MIFPIFIVYIPKIFQRSSHHCSTNSHDFPTDFPHQNRDEDEDWLPAAACDVLLKYFRRPLGLICIYVYTYTHTQLENLYIYIYIYLFTWNIYIYVATLLEYYWNIVGVYGIYLEYMEYSWNIIRTYAIYIYIYTYTHT